MRRLASLVLPPPPSSPALLPWFVMALLVGPLGGCTQTAVPAEGAAEETAETAVHADPEAKAHDDHTACGDDAEQAGADEAHDCTHGAGTNQLTHDEVEVRSENGREVLHAGKPFGGSETVAVADLLADPDAFVGKTVRVEGDVAAMCTHRRGWFAVAAGDQSGRTVRVITAPTFLVPQGSVGRSAVAEGTVEVIEVEAAFAEHLAEGHKLEKPAEGQEKIQQVILRAAGADFS